MGPNDVQIRRIYVKEVAGTISDDTIRVATPWQIVIEVEAGSTIHGGGTAYIVQPVIRNLTTGTTTVVPPIAGNMADASWPNQGQVLLFNPAPIPPAEANHMFEVIGFVRANVVNPDVSFARSEPFIAV